MKRYFSIREAAEKWGVSERRINQYCIEGRIPGHRKSDGHDQSRPVRGNPEDPRQNRRKAAPAMSGSAVGGTLLDHTNFMPLMNTPFQPGHCLEAVEAMAAGPQRDIALAEYHYFCGQPEAAVREAEAYLSSPDMGARFSASLLYAYANLPLGAIPQAQVCPGTADSLPLRSRGTVASVSGGFCLCGIHRCGSAPSAHARGDAGN